MLRFEVTIVFALYDGDLPGTCREQNTICVVYVTYGLIHSSQIIGKTINVICYLYFVYMLKVLYSVASSDGCRCSKIFVSSLTSVYQL